MAKELLFGLKKNPVWLGRYVQNLLKQSIVYGASAKIKTLGNVNLPWITLG